MYMSNNDQNQEKVEYLSSSIVYSTIKEEYDYELQRIQKIDTKVNIGFTLCSALFIFILQFFVFSDMSKRLKEDISLQLPFNFYFSFWLVMTISYASSFILLLLIIRSRKYYHINIGELISNNMHKQEKDITEVFIAYRYNKAIIKNRIINNKRMMIFNISLGLIFIVILCSVILSAIKFNWF